MSITKKLFGTMPDGKEIYCRTITSKNGLTAEILDYGATIRSIIVPDKDGNAVDVVKGYDTLQEYFDNDGYLGATIGRFGNRIRNSKFTLNGKEYVLASNDGVNHLHGGIIGFDKRVWDVEEKEDSLVYTLVSPDGEEGYPGTLKTTVEFSWVDNGLQIDYNAVSDKDTIVNLTNHSYFNLNGKGDIHSHLLTINDDGFTLNDDQCVPVGEIVSVKGTAMDFTTEKPIGKDVDSDEPCVKLSGGYDSNYVLNGKNPACIARSAENGIVMTVLTTEPGVQLYTGNMTSDRNGKNGEKFGKRCAFCLETQHYPDCINHPEWPSCILKAGEQFKSTTTYAFSIYNK